MKKLMAAVVILLGVTLTSCGTEDAVDMEPVSETTRILELEDVNSSTEEEEDPISHSGGD